MEFHLAVFFSRSMSQVILLCVAASAQSQQASPAVKPAPSAAAADPAPVASAASDLWTRPTLTGDWFGARPLLLDRGITIKPRVTQFYQGLAAGDDDHGFEYGGKADVLIAADLTKLGAWEGLSLAVHVEQNFGSNVNGRGGTLLPVNTALLLPGDEDSDAFDVTNVSFTQRFDESFSLTAGKINMVAAATFAAQGATLAP
jgi:porin